MFSRLPSLNAIRTFESAARLGSFKRAAEELSVSDTAVSHQIRSLERELEVTLFLRHTRRVSLTEAGEQLSRVCTSVFHQLNETLRNVSVDATSVRVSTTQAFAAMWLIPRLPDFQKSFPEVDVEISADDRLLDLNRESTADLSVRYGRYHQQTNALHLINESLGCYASPAYLAQKESKMARPVFLMTRWKNANLPQLRLEPLLVSSGIAGPFEIRQYDDENQTLQAALAGQGIAVLSQLLTQQAVQRGWILECLPELASEIAGLDYYAVFPSRKKASASVTAFIEWLQVSLALPGSQRE